MTDQLVRRAQRGDKDAFVALMEQYKAALYRAARAILHSDEDAADAIQETVLEAWRSLPKLEAPRYCKTWLTRVLIYNCYDILRRKKRETPVEFLPEQAAEEQGEEAPDGEAPGEAAPPEETEPAVEPAADTEIKETEEASHDE